MRAEARSNCCHMSGLTAPMLTREPLRKAVNVTMYAMKKAMTLLAVSHFPPTCVVWRMVLTSVGRQRPLLPSTCE